MLLLIAVPVFAWGVADLLDDDVQFGASRSVVALLVIGVVIGELLHIEVFLRGRDGFVLTLSTTFSVALLFVAPVGMLFLAQSIPLLLDDMKRGSHWSRPLFNFAQYTVTAAATRLAFCVMSGQGVTEPTPFRSEDVLASVGAGLVYFVVNNGLVAGVVALSSGQWSMRQLLVAIREQLITWGPTVAMAPTFVVVADFSLWLVPVMLLPIVAVRQISNLAREHRDSALHDTLTGLPNRAFFLIELDRKLAVRPPDGALGVMFIDLDHFKEINDTLGHEAGDALIRDIGNRLRSAGGDDVTVARLGGDEFAVLAELSDCGQLPLTQAIELAGKLTATLDEPVSVAGVRLEVRASVGIALAPQHARNSAELLAKADIAMYLAKGNGGGVAVYDPTKDENTTERLLLLTQLHSALAHDELTVFYQPKCDVRTGLVVGAEALVRWRHPDRGLLGAEVFIPVAETTELITQLTLVVLEQAIRQTRHWMDQGRWIGVAVNLSVRHLADVRLPEQVDQLLERYRVPAALLTLEVTENTVMTDPHRAVAVLAMLRSSGIRIAIDDYGTGYSSLAYLKRLSVDELKIDRSFIIGMTRDDNNQIIVKSTIELGHNLGLRLVAEGVEDVETWRHLEVLGCEVIQGYTVQAPLSAEEFDRWIVEWDAHRREHAIGELHDVAPVQSTQSRSRLVELSAPARQEKPA